MPIMAQAFVMACVLLTFIGLLSSASGLALRPRSPWAFQDYLSQAGRGARGGYPQVHTPFINDAADTTFTGNMPNYDDDDDESWEGYNDVMTYNDVNRLHPWNVLPAENSLFGKRGGLISKRNSLHDLLAKLRAMGGSNGDAKLKLMRFGTGRR